MKTMLKELEKQVINKTIQENIFDANDPGDPYFILMPVPNITGNLHIGHGINLVLQDVVARRKMLEGKNVYFPPGADHAGIMGQFTAEKHLATSSLSRHDLGKDEFNKYMYKEADRHIGNLLDEMKELGLKAHWSHSWFTHDEKRDEVVHDVFIRLYEKGLVYREKSVVNWCPCCGSCVSDMELSLEETKEKLYRIMVDTKAGKLTLLFVQPELLLGSVAIGITSQHENFKDLVGSTILNPLTSEKHRIYEVTTRKNSDFDNTLRLIVPSYNADDMSFALKNNLDFHNIYNDNGDVLFNNNLLSIEDVRNNIVDVLNSSSKTLDFKEFGQGRAYHSLCKTMVYPMVKPQWYMRMNRMEHHARELLENNNIKFSDIYWQKAHEAVLDNIRSTALPDREKWWEGACVGVAQGYSSNKDWVISRQNWWGQPVPAWYCEDCGHIMVGHEKDDRCEICNSTKLSADNDVLDVWFSCAMWPISVNPFGLRGSFTDVSVMGQDIFYFWVSSANMICGELYDQPAFKNAYVHGLLCDKNGKKMSKSLGNVISMKDIIAKYGSETLRTFVYHLMYQNAGSPWLKADHEDIDHANASLIDIYSELLDKSNNLGDADASFITLEKSLDTLDENIGSHIDSMHIGEAYRSLVEYINSISFKNKRFTHNQYFRLLKLIHPFHPFITNYLYHTCLGGEGCLSECTQKNLSVDELVMC